MTTGPDDALTLFLPDQAATEALGHHLAPLLMAGDVVLLSGEIGAGKSCFARAVIRRRLGAATEVPSPTYTLVQTYDGDDSTAIWHADLYRISGADEVIELGLLDAADTAICLVEWPDRAGDVWPATALRLAFAPQDDGRVVQMTGNARLMAGLRRHD
jgi:tRNA threonylcarbamoyl adenosine modification protein YjeE